MYEGSSVEIAKGPAAVGPLGRCGCSAWTVELELLNTIWKLVHVEGGAGVHGGTFVSSVARFCTTNQLGFREAPFFPRLRP